MRENSSVVVVKVSVNPQGNRMPARLDCFVMNSPGGGGLLLQEMIRSRYGYIIASEKNSKEDRRLARNSSESK